MKRFWVSVIFFLFMAILLVLSARAQQGTTCKQFSMKGQWSPTTAYTSCSIVTDQGSSYVSLVATINSQPSPTNPKWQLWAKAGTNGTNGTNGQSATIAIGPTTTLPPGSSASVFNSGDQQHVILNFGIPIGQTGEPGPPIPGLSSDGNQGIKVTGTIESAMGITVSSTVFPTKFTLKDANSKKWDCTVKATSVSSASFNCVPSVTP